MGSQQPLTDWNLLLKANNPSFWERFPKAMRLVLSRRNLTVCREIACQLGFRQDMHQPGFDYKHPSAPPSTARCSSEGPQHPQDELIGWLRWMIRMALLAKNGQCAPTPTPEHCEQHLGALFSRSEGKERKVRRLPLLSPPCPQHARVVCSYEEGPLAVESGLPGQWEY